MISGYIIEHFGNRFYPTLPYNALLTISLPFSHYLLVFFSARVRAQEGDVIFLLRQSACGPHNGQSVERRGGGGGRRGYDKKIS